MTSDGIGAVVLVGYGAIALAIVAWQALRAAVGPLVWALYVAERLVCGLLWRVRTVSAEGRPCHCPFPDESGALIVANHRSPADPVILWQNHHLAQRPRTIRLIRFLMARQFYEIRAMRWFYRGMRAIPVTRGGHDVAAVRSTLAEVEAGHWVGIFPEGGINRGPPGIKEASMGVAFLALNSKAPLYPVYIADAPVARTMVRALFRFARTRVIYGEPIDLTPFRGRRKSPELLEEVTDHIMTTIAELGGVSYAGRRQRRGSNGRSRRAMERRGRREENAVGDVSEAGR